MTVSSPWRAGGPNTARKSKYSQNPFRPPCAHLCEPQLADSWRLQQGSWMETSWRGQPPAPRPQLSHPAFSHVSTPGWRPPCQPTSHTLLRLSGNTGAREPLQRLSGVTWGEEPRAERANAFVAGGCALPLGPLQQR